MKQIHIIALLGIVLICFTSCKNKNNSGGDVKNYYTVTFDADGGTPAPPAQRVEKGKTATVPSPVPTKQNFLFIAWSLDGTNAYDFQTPVTKDITLKAKWQEESIVEYWQVAWELNGGTWTADDNHPTQVLKGGTLTEPNPPTKDGHTFEGWYREASLINKITFPYNVSGVTSDLTLYAKWKAKAPQPNPTAPGVYVAGTDRTEANGLVATIWKDGNVFKRFPEDNVTRGTSVFVGAQKVYSVGIRSGKYYSAMFYEDDQSKSYPLYSRAYSVFVSGEDIYVAGDANDDPCLWKNHKQIKLPSKSNYNGRARSVFVSGNDVYAAGYLLSSSGKKDIAVLWKNDQLVELSDGKTAARAHSVYVSGKDVYVVGEETSGSPQAILWKNSVPVQLPKGDFDHLVARSVSVSGGDVYIVGEARKGVSEFYAILWENNKITKLGYKAKASSVAVSGKDIYVAGYESDIREDQTRAVMWKNGTKTILGNSSSVARHIFIKE
ncbi:InlB B-repeat-containing protein [Porphyromonas canoris]|uniref:Repeat domain (List_Bact_rpt) n=1 Tax=Porphyromonas canoris TaxID=36875 RepID=A0ABR4XIY0_9PORP|nr:InlB B-repeat-containing protein [Porphyromonas canoris]KGN91661.1 hypothetical protein HQ43_06030 [Porphyromonas canoris]